ncbi:hypothetical protein [Pararhodobacter marinus]|uniref:Uncharacterized protein n=1 Tax=Pararhodobacter marinus TaxID=2184063 RepID=A0A2U2CGL8_9RHOB|nr:hypothetical protein [Pararhodobacter marinus]PWE30992.1 hypothetical protein C4N9_04375 [Pararhodobacter marinus]
MTTGELLIWGGAGVTLLGVVGLVACVIWVLRLRRQGLDDAALRRGLQKGVMANMAALFVSVIGLMMVIMGIAFA